MPALQGRMRGVPEGIEVGGLFIIENGELKMNGSTSFAWLEFINFRF